MPSFRDPALRRLTLPIAAVLGVALALLIPNNARLENAVNKAIPSHLDERLMLVGIDDASLRDYGRLDVWPRELYAAALKTLREAGVKGVGLDVLLSAPTSQDQTLNETFSQSNLVLATAPDDVLNPFPPQWQSPTGVSALNSPSFGSVRHVQTAYPIQATSALTPSFARQVAAQAGLTLPLNTEKHLIRYVAPEDIERRTLSFRDVVNGNIRFADVQDKVVVIGLTAHGVGNVRLPDIDGQLQPGSVLQLRAISSLLSPAIRAFPLWLVAVLCLTSACLAVWVGGLWGFGIAAGSLLLTLPAWMLNFSFPGVTISFAAVLGSALVAFEQWWTLRRMGTRDPLTGFGNRLAFTRAVEHRWATRNDKPFSLLLIDLDNLRKVNELHGRLAGEMLVRELGLRLQSCKRRGDVLFRWGPEEFAILLDQTDLKSLPDALTYYAQRLTGLTWQDVDVYANLGGAAVEADTENPMELIEAASRSRYRMKYQRELGLVPATPND